jgi:glycerol-3-phosphate dehydrogenase
MQSPLQARAAALASLRDRRFDLLVIGGGATGCGIAREGALRGLSVALVEKDDFASGTSSRSSRLIHGGVRYLEHGHIHLVFESSAERHRLLELAPHLVRPLEFTWPVYEHARIPRWKLAAGLTLYDALALFRNVGRHHRLGRDALLEREPMLRREGLRGGATYWDASTDDARLTLANAIDAAELGAVMVNHARVVALCADAARGRITGATVADGLSDARFDVSARVIVNATGPWSDDVRHLDEPGGTTVRGSKGVHIAVPRQRVGNRQALTLLSPTDGRVFFVLPARARAIIGTTDTYTTSTPDQVRADQNDVNYLLDAANAFFPAASLTPHDVVGAWAGIRPLVPSTGENPGAVSREHALATSRHGVISVTGGKLTTYRVMAHDVADAVVRRLGLVRDSGSRSAKREAARRLPGGDFESFDNLVAQVEREVPDTAVATHLASAFGSRWRETLTEGESPSGADTLAEGFPYTLGELLYSVRREMAMTLGDLLIRRTRLAYETSDHGLSVAPHVADVVGPTLGWDETGRRQAIVKYAAEVERVFGIDPARTTRRQ